jgi:hypothetical protein
LRSPSATIEAFCSGAIFIDGSEDVRAGDFDMSEVSGAAQSAQNFASGAFGCAHFGQVRLRGVAHWLQNLASAAFSLPQFVQRFDVLIFSGTERLVLSPVFANDHSIRSKRNRKGWLWS